MFLEWTGALEIKVKTTNDIKKWKPLDRRKVELVSNEIYVHKVNFNQ